MSLAVDIYPENTGSVRVSENGEMLATFNETGNLTIDKEGGTRT